jgi:hypothetical protein
MTESDLERMLTLLESIKVTLRMMGAELAQHEAAVDGLVVELRRSNGNKR